jgi:hypothetical protein
MVSRSTECTGEVVFITLYRSTWHGPYYIRPFEPTAFSMSTFGSRVVRQRHILPPNLNCMSVWETGENCLPDPRPPRLSCVNFRAINTVCLGSRQTVPRHGADCSMFPLQNAAVVPGLWSESTMTLTVERTHSRIAPTRCIRSDWCKHVPSIFRHVTLLSHESTHSRRLHSRRSFNPVDGSTSL